MNFRSFTFATEKEKEAFVIASEKAYHASVDAAIEVIRSRGDLRFIALAGPTCSGKTTTAKLIIDKLCEEKRRVVVISIDDFFFDREYLHDMAKTSGEPLDLDSVKTIDLKQLAVVVADLEAGKATLLPHFDFTEGRQTYVTEFLPQADDIYLFEGIQAIYPEVVSLFEPSTMLRLYISIEQTLVTPFCELSPREQRLLRRLLRDSQFRGTDAETTLTHWSGVVANETKNIDPYVSSCELHIDSSLPYELAVMKDELISLLRSVRDESPHSLTAREYCRLLSNFSVISSSMVPQDSVLREFIGE